MLLANDTYVTFQRCAEFLTLRDISNETGAKTITNDAERVVKELLDSGRLTVGMRLFYVDTEGHTDELGFDANGFTRFILL